MTTSSIFNKSISFIPYIQIKPPTAPIIIACPIEGVSGSAVIATSPAIAPLRVAAILV